MSVVRWGARVPMASPRAMVAASRPSATPTAAAASALCTEWRPSAGVVTSIPPVGSESRNRIPRAASDRTWSADTSAEASKPYVSTRAVVLPAIAATSGSSALSTAVPVAGKASTSSRLPAAMASRVPDRDRWTARTAVTTPIDGRATSHSRAMSPGTYRPISSTAAACPAASRRRVRGNPTSLFWLPGLRRTFQRAPRTSATCSLVDVLAIDPVMPTTTGSNRSRHAEDAASSASPVAETAMMLAPSRLACACTFGSPQVSDTTSAAAPASMADPRCLCPSVRAPARAKNA